MDTKSMQNWPECYYLEEDRKKRKALLLQNMSENPDSIDNQIRMKLWELRYQPRKKMPDHIDYFIKAFVELLTEAKINLGFFNRRQERKRMNSIMHDLGILSDDLFSCDEVISKENLESLLYLEYQAFARFYIHISRQDKRYGSALMGTITLKDSEVDKKLKKDFHNACVVTPQMFDLADDFGLFHKACLSVINEEIQYQ